MERSCYYSILCKSCQEETANLSPLGSLARTCKSCSCEFTASRWASGLDIMFKFSIICQECSKKNNLCQICCINHHINLPGQVPLPGFGINTNYSLPRGSSNVGKAGQNETTPKFTPSTPYMKERREACRYYNVEAGCRKGDTCSFSHKSPKVLMPLEDDSIRTLHVGGIDIDSSTIIITEQDLRGRLGFFGEIESICMVLRSRCAFVTYVTREGAEKAITMNRLFIKGRRLKLSWAKSQTVKAAEKTDMEKIKLKDVEEEERQKILLQAGELAANYLEQNRYMNAYNEVMQRMREKIPSVEASSNLSSGSDEN